LYISWYILGSRYFFSLELLCFILAV